jgi:hypothetical protein
MNDAHVPDGPSSPDDDERRSPADRYVQRLIDGDLPRSEEAEALHAIADDPEARSVLRFELAWSGEAARAQKAAPPPAFADGVMDAIAAADAARAPTGATSPDTASPDTASPDASPDTVARLRDWLRPLTVPLTFTLRPVVAMLIAAALGVLTWQALSPAGPTEIDATGASGTSLTTGPATTPNGPQAAAVSDNGSVVWMRFVYSASDAESVAVAGDFSQWEPIPLSPRTVRGQIIWTGLVPVGRGEHEYQFVINGETWVTDPLAPIQRDDGFGAQNAVLKL